MANLIPVVLALLCIINCACSYYDEKELEEERIRKCGDELSGKLSKICDGKFATVKRAYRGPANSKNLKNSNEVDINNELPYPLQNPWKSSQLIPSRFRRFHGIVDECCRSPCTLYELQSYCYY